MSGNELALAHLADAGARGVQGVQVAPAPSAAALLEELRDLGVRLRVDGDLLRASGQTAALTPELRRAIGEAKPDLLALLVRGPVYACVHCDRFSYPTPGTVCHWCRRQGHASGAGLRHPNPDERREAPTT